MSSAEKKSIPGNMGISVNVYSCIDSMHNILYKMEGAGGLDAAKRLLPIIAYIIKMARDGGGTQQAVVQVVNSMLNGDLRKIRDDGIASFIDLVSDNVKDEFVKRFLKNVAETVRSLRVSTLKEILMNLARNVNCQRALINYEALGALFEKMVYEAFKGGSGQYLTHKNIILAMREIAWAQFESEGISPKDIRVYDPCAGSARFLTAWLEKVVEVFPEYREPGTLRKYAENHLYATDLFEEMVSIASINMMIYGNGIANIFRADATNHFGPIVDLKSSQEFLKTFKEKWNTAKLGIAVSSDLKLVEENVYKFADLVLKGLERRNIEIIVSSNEFISFIELILELRKNDIAVKAFPSLNDLIRLTEFPPIVYLIKKGWRDNVKRGFDLILTNPPMGRSGRGGRGELLIDDKYILSQYTLAQNVWLRDISRKSSRSWLRN